MGLLVEGQWRHDGYEYKDGKFKRESSQFRHWITADGKAGPTGDAGFKAEADRYHLYISLACPWACRAHIFRTLKKLENIISLSVVEPLVIDTGWKFSKNDPKTKDPINGFDHLHQVYTACDPKYTGRVSVPILWDKQTQQIVNNESSEIIRMLNSAFDAYTDVTTDYYPEKLRGEIDAINEIVYTNVNNGVYKCGFATTQEAYEEAFGNLFNALDQLEKRLSQQRYLVGNQITEADWRLFTTLVRFDSVYVGHFKTNLRRISDYHNLDNYLRDLYQQPGIADTVDMPHIKTHYYASHLNINPTGIVPKGPEIDLMAPHDRT